MEVARRFGIADGLILIAGVGVGLGLVRCVAPSVTPTELWSILVNPPGGWTPEYAIALGAEFCGFFVTPFVAPWTLACLLVQLKSDRPGRLRRVPGFVACLLPTLGCAVTIATTWTILGRPAWGPIDPSGRDEGEAQFGSSLLVGTSVLWAWVTMKVCGIWRARPTWTDRLGRLTGVVWVAIGILSGCYLVLLSAA